MHVVRSTDVNGVSAGQSEQPAADDTFTTILPLGHADKHDEKSEALYDPDAQVRQPWPEIYVPTEHALLHEVAAELAAVLYV